MEQYKDGNSTITCHSHGMLDYSLALLELQIALIFIISHTFHFFLKRFRIPFIVSSMIAGIILGPTFLGKYEGVREHIFPPYSQTTLSLMAIIGIDIFMFLSAVKMDVGMVFQTGKKAMSIGIIAVLAPLLIGLVFKKYVNEHNEYHGDLDLIVLQSVTSFPVVSYLIDHLQLSNTELGRLGLSSALVADVTGVFMTSAASFVRADPLSWETVKERLGVVVFVLVLACLFRPLALRVIRNTPQGKPVSSSWICVIMALIILSTMYFYELNQGTHMAPFIFGFFVPAGPPLGSAFVDRFEAMALGIILPIQFAISMMRVDLLVILSKLNELAYYIALIAVVYSVKMAACFLPALISRMPLINSVALSFIISCKGIVELSIYVSLQESQVINRSEVFGIVISSILISSAISPIFASRLYDPSKKYAGRFARNMAGLKPDSELRILTCIHTPEDVSSSMRLLDTTYPTKESPVSVYVLHLIELIGRATPVFLTHEKNKPISNVCSQNVILAFDRFERSYTNSLSVHNFTAISPTNIMHEDICTLALDKLTSLIIIPLHQKWSDIYGFVQSENLRLRTLTRGVLERAPCSVGIYYDGGKFSHKPSKATKRSYLSLCMIFIGGGDDREALTLAKRMASNSFAKLTVVHFVAEEEDEDVEWEEKVFDDKAIEDIKQFASSNEYVFYQQHRVKDGAQTALTVHSIADNNHELFIIGRRYGIISPQTDGLSQWSEDPELGTMGDLLTSKDVNNGFSVLILHQQREIL